MAEDQNPLLGNLDTGDEPWSLEETQASILAELRKILSSGKIDSKTLGIISKNISVLAKDSETVHDMDKQLKDIAGSSKKDEKHSDALSKAFKKESGDRRKDNKALRKDITDSAARSQLQGASGFAKKKFGDISHWSKRAVQGLSTFDGSLRSAAVALGIGGPIGAIIGMMNNQLDAYQALSGAGQTFSGDMLKMSKQAAEAGISLEQMKNLVIKNSRISANIGTKAVLDHQKAVRKDIQAFGQFGFTLNEVTQFSIDHLEQLQVTGMLERMDNMQRRQATTQYLYNLTELSKATGKHREEIAADMKKQSENMETHTVRLSLSGQRLLDFNKLTAPGGPVSQGIQMLGPDMGKAFENALNVGVVRGNVMLDKNIRHMSAIGALSQETVNALQEASQSLHPADYKKAMELATRDIKAFQGTEAARTAAIQAGTSAQIENVMFLARSTMHINRLGPAAEEAKKALDKNAEAVRKHILANQDQLTEGQKSTAILANLPSQMSSFMADIRKQFLETFGPRLQAMIVGISDFIKGNMDSIKMVGDLLMTGMEGLGAIFKFVIENFKLVAGGAALMAAAWIALKIKRAITGKSSEAAARRLARAQNRAATAADRFARSAGRAAAAGGGGGRRGRGIRGALGRATGAVGNVLGGGGGGMAGKLMGGAGKALGFAGRLAGKAFLPLAALMAAGDAIGGYQRAGENFGLKPGEKATAGQKASSALGGVASGLTMGLVDEKSAARWIGSLFGIGKDTAKEKVKEKAESVAKVAAGDSGMRLGTSEEQAVYLKELQKQNALAEEANELRRKQLIAAESIAKSTQRAEPDPMAGFVGG